MFCICEILFEKIERFSLKVSQFENFLFLNRLEFFQKLIGTIIGVLMAMVQHLIKTRCHIRAHHAPPPPTQTLLPEGNVLGSVICFVTFTNKNKTMDYPNVFR